jgi:hypothetical protein
VDADAWVCVIGLIHPPTPCGSLSQIGKNPPIRVSFLVVRSWRGRPTFGVVATRFVLLLFANILSLLLSTHGHADRVSITSLLHVHRYLKQPYRALFLTLRDPSVGLLDDAVTFWFM